MPRLCCFNPLRLIVGLDDVLDFCRGFGRVEERTALPTPIGATYPMLHRWIYTWDSEAYRYWETEDGEWILKLHQHNRARNFAVPCDCLPSLGQQFYLCCDCGAEWVTLNIHRTDQNRQNLLYAYPNKRRHTPYGVEFFAATSSAYPDILLPDLRSTCPRPKCGRELRGRL